jgi:predicted metal-dependent phosphoesterase TrpH
MPYVDIIEVYNARSLSPGDQIKAQKLALKYGTMKSAGSDAHTPDEIGNAYVEMKEFNNKSEFLKSLKYGEITGHKSNPLVHLTSTLNKLKKRFA